MITYKDVTVKTSPSSGFTLVELLVVLALSSLLSSALFQIVSANKQNIMLADSYAKIQESGRYAMDYLSRDIRMAGYLGCVNTNMDSEKITSLLNSNDIQFDPDLHDYQANVLAIDNYNSENITHPDEIGGVIPVEGTDIFITNATVASDMKVKLSPAANSAVFLATGPKEQLAVLKQGLVLMVTDCNTAHIFSVSNNIPAYNGAATVSVVHNKSVSNGPDNISSGFGVNYSAGSQILLMNRTIYFIGQSRLVPEQKSLFRYSLLDGAEAQELVPYVENMQLLYSVDVNGNKSPDIYKTAAQIEEDGDDMTSDVYSVNIELSIATAGNTEFSNFDHSKEDSAFRKRYARVVNIRNAGFGTF